MNKRVLIKVSGEQLAGKQENGLDRDFMEWLSKEIKKVTSAGIEVAIVVGGGNYIRGADFAGDGIEAATAHYMGMMATVINGMGLTDVLEHNGVPTRLQTSFEVKSVAEPFIRRRALRHLDKGRVVICAAGTGRPFVTTDSASVLFALELGCDVVLKATNVDGVYDDDPAKNDQAKRFESLSFQEAIENPKIKVMDKAAIGLAMEQKLPIVVFDIRQEGNILKAAQGDGIGTKIS